MGNAWDNAKDGIMSEEDYPYEHKVHYSWPLSYISYTLICFSETIEILLKDGECRYNSSQAVASVTGHES